MSGSGVHDPMTRSLSKSWNLVAQTSAARIDWLLATLVTTAIMARYLGPSFGSLENGLI